MTLRKVSVVTENNQTFEFTLRDFSAPYRITNIEGLDPVKASIVSSNFGSADGGQYQSSRRDQRNILMELVYNPDYLTNDVASLRKDLYLGLAPKSRVRLRFEDSIGPTVETIGWVESFESSMFAQDPIATLSILCFDPDFYNVAPTIVPLSSVNDTTENQINYVGNTDTGFLVSLNVDRSITDVTLIHKDGANNIRSIEFTGTLIAGDLLEINTVVGAKGAWRTRDGFRTSVLYSISPQSIWTRLYPGWNSVRLYIPGSPIPYTITYYEKFGGL